MDMQDAPLVYELATEMPIRLLKLLVQSLQYCLLCVIVPFLGGTKPDSRSIVLCQS